MAAATLPTPSAASPEREEQEYFLLYDAFARLLDCWTDSAARYSALETLIEMRAGTLIERLLDGLGLDLEQALEILKRRDDFSTQQERERRDILAAGIENMLDFAAAEEYAMCCDLPEKVAEDDYEFCDAVFERYNGHRAVQENLDVEYAAVMAAWWLTVGTEQMLTFTTQGETAGAQAWSSIDTYCAPFIRYDALTKKQVKPLLPHTGQSGCCDRSAGASRRRAD